MGDRYTGVTKSGKFIRKNDPILDIIKISPFNLQEISVHKTAIPDNASNTIIHKRLHSPEVFEHAIKESSLEKIRFEPEGGRRPVLVPLDFTKDWEVMKKRITKRQSKFDEDDDDLEIYEAMQSSRTTEPKRKGKEEKTSEQETPQKKTDAKPETNAEHQENKPKETPETINETVLSINKEKEALDSIARSLPGEDQNPLGSGIAPEQSPEAVVTTDTDKQPEAPNPQENEAPDPSTPKVPEAETPPTETEKEAYDKGFQSGLADGFKEVQKDYDEKSKIIGSMMAELEGLKKNILHNAQNNFQKICESMMEAILKKEYKANPETFANVIKRAIDETVDDDEFKIRVHPEQIKTLETFFEGEIASHIVSDENIPLGDFKIESNHKVIDGKTSKLIEDLLNQADLNIFDKGEAS